MIGRMFVEADPHWTFLVRREVEESGQMLIRLLQRCRSDGAGACRAPGIREHRQNTFRRFVRTGEPANCGRIS